MRVSVLSSVLIHLFILFVLPVGIFTTFKTKDIPAATEVPSEAGILTVMEIATGSFVVGDYRLEDTEKPGLPPEQELDAALELPEDVLSALTVTPGAGGEEGVRGAAGREGSSSGGGTAAALGRYTPPVPVIIMWPSYPPSAQSRGVRGTVTVRVHVSTEGSVDRAEVVSGLEDHDCRVAALQAAMKLRFLPALLGNTPVDAWFSYPVEFGKKK